MVRSRAKGAKAELDVVKHLRRHGYPNADRRGAGLDGSDVVEVDPRLEIEVKDHRNLDLQAWLRQLDSQMRASGASFGIVIAKRARRSDVGDWYAVTWWPAMVEYLTLVRVGYEVHDANLSYAALPMMLDEATATAAPNGSLPVLRLRPPGVQNNEGHIGVTSVYHMLWVLKWLGLEG